MHYSYMSSVHCTLRSKGSLSFSFNDYSQLSNQRCDRTPLLSSPCCCRCRCSCCSICPLSSRGISTDGSYLYGLRQSTLLQRSASKRLILGGGDRYHCRVLAVPYGSEQAGREAFRCNKERNVGRSRMRTSGGPFECTVSEENSGKYQLNGLDEVDAVISLLTEECFVGNETKWNASRRVEKGKAGSYLSGSCRRKSRNVGSDVLEDDSKREFRGVLAESSREEETRQTERRKGIFRDQNRRGRTGNSSCSSYYSLSSGEFEHDGEESVERSSDQPEVDGARHEVSTSEIIRDKKIFEKELVYEGDNYRQKSSSRHYPTKSQYRESNSGLQGSLQNEMIEKAKHDASTSHMPRDKHIIKKRVVHEGENYEQKGSSQHGFENSQCRDSNTSLGASMQNKLMIEKARRERSTSEILRDKKVTEKELLSEDENYMQQSSSRQGSGETECTKSDSSLVGSMRNKTMIEKARHDVSTSEILRDTKILRKDLIYEDENYRQKNSNQQGFSQYRDYDTKLEGSLQSEPAIQDISISGSGCGSIVLQSHGGGRQVFCEEPHDVDRGNENLGEPSVLSNDGDVDSACLDLSSVQIIGKSVEKTRQHKQKSSVKHHSELKSQDHVLLQNETETGTLTQEVHSGASARGSGILQSHIGGDIAGLHQKPYGRKKRDHIYGDSSNFVTQEEASRVPADCLEKSSERFVTEFVEEDSQYKQKTSSQYGSELIRTVGSLQDEIPSNSSSAEAPVGASGSESSILQYHEGTAASLLESHIRQKRDQISGEQLTLMHDDALGSASRMEKSSMQLVGEFMEKARNEVSTSEVQKDENITKSELISESENLRQQILRQHVSKDNDHECGSRYSSEGSRSKEPSGEMWHVTDPSVRETSKEEEQEETETSSTAIVRRTGRSFWNIITDVVRLRWASRAETPKSVVTSGEKAATKDSVSSETWFSGHEVEGNSDGNMKGERRSLSQETATSDHLQVEETFSQSSAMVTSRDKIRRPEGDASLHPGALEVDSATKVVSSSSTEYNSDWTDNEKSFLGEPAGLEVGKSSLPLSVGPSKRSPIIRELTETGRTKAIAVSARNNVNFPITGEIPDIGRVEASDSGSIKQTDGSVSIGLNEASGTKAKDVELKGRKLQRNNQVLKDKFDEWEEAYKFEIEQQKVDEMYMREALLEARKAADSWEVPVGAVLVQNGKIIARGCNLVEELRDSTAHAEMICIREASNQLRSWRLAETTLYVTLEPCPMCAGAILQARIDTLVWGAPNKLLGADGSWIRLFPDTEGGINPYATDKPVAPVHPFHPKMKIRRGVLSTECAEVMQQFFQLRRRKKEKKAEAPAPQPRLQIAHHPSKFLSKMHQIFHVFFCL